MALRACSGQRPETKLSGTTYTQSLKDPARWPQCLAPKLASPPRHVRTVGTLQREAERDDTVPEGVYILS